MEAAITWLVLWAVIAFVVAPLAGWIVSIIGAAIALDNNSEGGALTAVIVGWLLGGAFFHLLAHPGDHPTGLRDPACNCGLIGTPHSPRCMPEP